MGAKELDVVITVIAVILVVMRDQYIEICFGGLS